MNIHNIGALLDHRAEHFGNQPALKTLNRENHQWDTLTFEALKDEVHRLAGGLVRYGILKGHRVLLMVPAGQDFIALTYALFKVGAIPVLIDPGLGRKHVLNCIRNAKPDAMIAIPIAHAIRLVFPGVFRSVKIKITAGTRWLWGGPTLDQVRLAGRKEFSSAERKEEDPAAILFTSGSTGPPKGVVYTHGMFYHQVEALKRLYAIQPGEVDLPAFPLFALFGVALGMTSILPDMDATRPAEVEPQNITGPIQEFSVTNSFGSPALWNKVTRYCIDNNVQLPTLKRVLIAGAPVRGDLLERFHNILADDGLAHTPYGATESLPVASIDHREIIKETWTETMQGKGTCVGTPVDGMTVRFIEITDDPIEEWKDELEIADGQIGELVVDAPWVTQEYFELDEANLNSKIKWGTRKLHRMGDVGYRDDWGRLWFCGRKSQRVVTAKGTLFTICCEAIFNRHDAVNRSALVGVGEKGQQQPVIVIELNDHKEIDSIKRRLTLISELLEIAGKFDVTKDIQQVLFHPSFPVDVRHNAKIGREQLAQWAKGHIKE